jgi:hypothetical protein
MYFGYQASPIGQYRAAAGYVDRILRCETGRASDSVADQIPIRRQSQDRQVAGLDGTGNAACDRR